MMTQHSSPLRKLPLCAMAVMASVVGFSASANAATLIQGEFQYIGDTNFAGTPANPGISVTSGSEGYSTGTDGLGTGGLDGTFNGSILDYAFYSNNGGITENLAGAGSFLNLPTAGSVSSDVVNAIDIWAGNSTAAAPNQEFYMRADNLTGSVDISALTEGSLYMFFGTRVGAGDLVDVTFTISGVGPVVPTLSEVGINTTSLGGTQNNAWFVYRADFADAADYDTLTYTYDYTNSTNNGARGRFGGLVLTAVPEPATALLGGLGALLLLRRRRCS